MEMYYEDHYGTPPYRYPYRKYRVRDNGVWIEDSVPYLFLSMPIIERACDTCPVVRGLQCRNGTEGRKVLTWNSGTNHRRWQVSYGPAGTPAGEGTLLECTSRMANISGLSRDSDYVAYVRPLCHFARDTWGDWSDSVVMTFRETGGIDEAGALAMELVPNPAQERVTVRCAQAEGGTVSVVDMQGRTLLTQAAKATTVLDISTLPDGPYLVRIVTPTATATRKLSVVR